MTKTITVKTHVPVTPESAWAAFTDADAITRWNFASSDWCCPSATVDLRPGGRHLARKEAKDGSMGFDYTGTYEEVAPPATVELRLDDGRLARTTFTAESGGTHVCTIFDADPSHSAEMQRDGWQAILDNYSAYVRETMK